MSNLTLEEISSISCLENLLFVRRLSIAKQITQFIADYPIDQAMRLISIYLGANVSSVWDREKIKRTALLIWINNGNNTERTIIYDYLNNIYLVDSFDSYFSRLNTLAS